MMAVCLQAKSGLTKRAVDWRDSAAFLGFFYARTESCSRSFIYARPPTTNANRWATPSLAKIIIHLQKGVSNVCRSKYWRYIISSPCGDVPVLLTAYCSRRRGRSSNLLCKEREKESAIRFYKRLYFINFRFSYFCWLRVWLIFTCSY
jgi:hypothetical protein